MWKLTVPFEYTVNDHVTVVHVVVDSPVTVECCAPAHCVESFTLRITLLVVPALNSQLKYMVAPAVKLVYILYTAFKLWYPVELTTPDMPGHVI